MKKNYCLIMAMLIMCMTNAFGQVNTWDGSISSSLTKDGETYLIQSGADLAFLAQEVNKANTTYVTASYKLTTDIDLDNRNWEPIGYNGKEFKGVFNGDNHTISSVSITANVNSIGFFGKTNGASLSNIILKNSTVNVSNTQNAAILVGECLASSGTQITISKCSVYNSILESTGGNGNYGILIGKTWNGVINNSAVHNSSISVKTTIAQSAGGFVGAPNGGQGTTFNNCSINGFSFNKESKRDLTIQGLFCGKANDAASAQWVKFNYCFAEMVSEETFTGSKTATLSWVTFNHAECKTTADFANPELAWQLNTSGNSTTNSAIWSHNGEYPIFADTNNMPVYKAGTIYNNSMVGEQCYTSGVLPENFTAIDLRTNTETIPDTDLATLLNKGSKNLLVYSGSTINNYTGNVITGNNPSISLTDGAPFHCPIEITNANVTYTRDFLDGWNTICLPFGFTTTAEDEDKVESLVSGTAESVSFEYVTDGTVANTPYLINIKNAGAKTFNATNVTIPTSASLSDVTTDGYTFNGTMTTSILTEGYGLVLDNATQEVMFKKIPETGSEITPFRAYLTSTAAPASAPLKVIHGNGGATNIDKDTPEETILIYTGNRCINIIAGKAQTMKMFSIDGRQIRTIQLNEGSNTISEVNEGIYLINNQKVLVK